MIEVKIKRFCYAPIGTFGRLEIPEFSCYTVERPWLGNQRYVSCIPEGEYEIYPGRFHRGGYNCWEFHEVPDRSLIKIHRANRPLQLQGCVGLGEGLGVVAGEWAVTNSRAAHDAWMDAMEVYEGVGRRIKLTITQDITPG